MTQTTAQAALLGWYDISPGNEQEHERWYRHEHMPERLALPGFLAGRRYRRTETGAGPMPSRFTLYETESLAALESPEYMARLAAPTAQTEHLAPTAINSVRAATELVAQAGTGIGGWAATTAFEPRSDKTVRLTTAITEAVGRSELLRARLYRAAEGVTARKRGSNEARRVDSADSPEWVLLSEAPTADCDPDPDLLAALAAAGLRQSGPPTTYSLAYMLLPGD